VAGLAAIYLSQVRVSLVITLGMMIVYATVAARQGRPAARGQFAILAGGIVVGGFMLALTLGGPSIMERFLTLTAADPLTVYHGARGVQLDVTFGQMFVDAPLGSGLGRWGMIGGYRHRRCGQDARAEIQFTDG
jgi:hypothetical protein